jgi:hypothetical protein
MQKSIVLCLFISALFGCSSLDVKRVTSLESPEAKAKTLAGSDIFLPSPPG